MVELQPIPTCPTFKDITGQTFGQWTVIGFSGKNGERMIWWCRCQCGTEKRVWGCHLKSGKSQSCGHKIAPITGKLLRHHGGTYLPEFRTWQAIRRRCHAPNNPAYQFYGARGITVCDRWRDSFENFYADMGQRPSAKHSIERIDNSGNYEPNNCRWATHVEQSNNKRNNRFLEFRGLRLTVAQWSRKTGLRYLSILDRLEYGWTVERTLTTPIKNSTITDVFLSWLSETQGLCSGK